MTVLLIGVIHRYVGSSGDTKPSDDTVPVGSRFYETDTTTWFIWDGSDWQTLAAELVGATDLDAVLALSTGQNISDALTGAASPSAANVFATTDDIANLPTTAEKTFLDAVPTSDPGDGVTIWADTGVLKIASGP